MALHVKLIVLIIILSYHLFTKTSESASMCSCLEKIHSLLKKNRKKIIGKHTNMLLLVVSGYYDYR